MRKLGYNLDRERVFRKARTVIRIYASTVATAMGACLSAYKTTIRACANTITIATGSRPPEGVTTRVYADAVAAAMGACLSAYKTTIRACATTITIATGSRPPEGKNHDPHLCKHGYNRDRKVSCRQAKNSIQACANTITIATGKPSAEWRDHTCLCGCGYNNYGEICI